MLLADVVTQVNLVISANPDLILLATVGGIFFIGRRFLRGMAKMGG